MSEEKHLPQERASVVVALIPYTGLAIITASLYNIIAIPILLLIAFLCYGYAFLWFYNTTNEINSKVKGPASWNVILFGVLLILGSVLVSIVAYELRDSIGNIVTYSYLALLYLYFVYFVWNYSKAVKEYTSDTFNFYVGLVLLALLPTLPLGMGYTQFQLNKVARAQIPVKTQEFTSLSQEEERMKKYIEDNKNSFSKDALTDAIVKSGVPLDNAKNYVDKYY